MQCPDKIGNKGYANSVQRKLCPIAQGWWILQSGLWILVLTCPKGKWCFLGNSNYRRTVINAAHQNFWGATLKTIGLVHIRCTSNNLSEWQAGNRLSLYPGKIWRWGGWEGRTWCCYGNVLVTNCYTQKLSGFPVHLANWYQSAALVIDLHMVGNRIVLSSLEPLILLDLL